MDKKNYDVDNILDEIKQRKARQRAETSNAPSAPVRQVADIPPPPPNAPAPPPEPDGSDTMGFEPPRSKRPPAFIPQGASLNEAEDGATVMSLPVEKAHRNPLNFGGHVQSITDRARNRPTRFASGQAAQQATPPVAPITVRDTPPASRAAMPTGRAVAPAMPPYAAPLSPPAQQGFTFAPPQGTPTAQQEFTFAPPQGTPTAHATAPAAPSHAGPLSPPAQQEFTFAPPEGMPTAHATAPAAPSDAAPQLDGKVIDFSLYRPPVDEDPDYTAPADMQDGSKTRAIPNVSFWTNGQIPTGQQYDGADYEDSLDEPGTAVDMGEYNRMEDRAEVSRDIANTKLWLWMRTVLTLGLTVSLIYLTLSGKYPLSLPTAIFPETNLQLFLASFAVLGTLVALVCSSTVGGGIISLFKLRANSDTMVALALLASIGQCVAAALRPENADIANMTLYISIAATAMLFNCFGKLTMVGRIQANFRVVAGAASKRAVVPVQSDRFVSAFIPPDGGRRPTVAHSVEAGFFTDFLGLSYSDKYDVGINRGVAPICLVGALLVGALTYMLTKSMPTAFSALTAILCVAATFSGTFIENIPLAKLTKRLVPDGGMVSGNRAVESFCDTKAVTLSEKDLFPPGHLQIHGIKADRIDEAILDAASVICATESALGPVFLQMIGGRKELLKRVENIVFEDEKGISAWVDSRRILIGNRDLMNSHGVALPAEVYRAQSDQQPEGELIYLSNSGEVSAQFMVSYQIDEELAVELDYLQTKDVRLIVHTIDPGLTAQRLWLLYGYPKELIQIMPASLHNLYGQMTAPRETEAAEMVYSGKAYVMLRMVRSCMGARTSILTATIIQLVQVVLGYGMITFIAFMGAMSALSIVHIGIYQMFWFLGILLIQQLRSD